MLLIRYEKDSLKDYIIYNVDNNSIYPIISADNGFKLCYLNKDYQQLRIYFKIILYNKNINYYIEDVLIFINDKFNTVDENWTVIKKEQMLGGEHIIELYFFSNKYYTKLYHLKNLIDNLYHKEIHFDISIYYKLDLKYKQFITTHLPNQTDYSNIRKEKYTLLIGEPCSLVLTNIENLNEYEL